MTGRTDRYSRGTPEVRRKYCTSARSSRRRQPLVGHALQPNNCQRGAAKVDESLQSEAVIGVGRKLSESGERVIAVSWSAEVGGQLSKFGERVVPERRFHRRRRTASKLGEGVKSLQPRASCSSASEGSRPSLERWNRRTAIKFGAVQKNDHNSLYTDFFRVYLVQACEPPSVIQHYTYRTTGRYIRSNELRNIPQNVVGPLIGCCLDGMGLGAELDLNVEDIMRSPTSFWKGLGKNNESRKKAFEIRKKQRANWATYYRTALSRAMADIRQYVVKHGVLTPRPKHYNLEIEVPTTSATNSDGEDDPMPQ